MAGLPDALPGDLPGDGGAPTHCAFPPRNARPKDAGANWVAAVISNLVSDTDYQAGVLSGEIAGIDPFVDEMTKMGVPGWPGSSASPAGLDRRLLANALERPGPLTPEDRQQFAELTGKMDAPWAVIEDYTKLPVFPAALRPAVANGAEDLFYGSCVR